MKTIATILTLLLATTTLFAESNDPDPKKSEIPVPVIKLTIAVGDQIVTATVHDKPTSRDFISLLPLKLTLKDYASTEKISDLPRKLSTRDAPPGSDPSIGDITYYAPWGNLALFYKDFEYSRGLIKIAKIDSATKLFDAPGEMEVTIDLVRVPRVTLRPVITVTADSDVELAMHLHQEAHEKCFIANSANFLVRCESEISRVKA